MRKDKQPSVHHLHGAPEMPRKREAAVLAGFRYKYLDDVEIEEGHKQSC